MEGRFAAVATLLVALGPASAPAALAERAAAEGAAAEGAAAEAEAPIWVAARDGKPFRVRFDPGHRMFFAVLADARAGTVGAGIDIDPAFGLGLSLRAPRPDGDWEVFWKRDHEIAHLILRPAEGGASQVLGHLYRGTFMRRARAGALTIPTTPPLRFPVPFDIGLRIELGHVRGALRPERGGSGLLAGVVRGDVLTDFWRSSRPGRWMAIGLGARYDVRVTRAVDGALNLDHRIAPMTALTLAARTESDNGLFAGSIDLEASHRWSSARGWEQTARAEVEAEIIPLAINDRPLSLLVRAGGDWGAGRAGVDVDADLFALVGVRFAAPLR